MGFLDLRSRCLIAVMDKWAKCAFLRVVGGGGEHIHIHLYIPRLWLFSQSAKRWARTGSTRPSRWSGNAWLAVRAPSSSCRQCIHTCAYIQRHTKDVRTYIHTCIHICIYTYMDMMFVLILCCFCFFLFFPPLVASWGHFILNSSSPMMRVSGFMLTFLCLFVVFPLLMRIRLFLMLPSLFVLILLLLMLVFPLQASELGFRVYLSLILIVAMLAPPHPTPPHPTPPHPTSTPPTPTPPRPHPRPPTPTPPPPHPHPTPTPPPPHPHPTPPLK